MKNTISSLTLIFENGDSVIIDGKDVKNINIRDVRLDINSVGLDVIIPMHYSNDVDIVLRKEANKPFKDIRGRDAGVVFGRIRQYNDIVCIEIRFNDKNDFYSVYPTYLKDSEDNNQFQSSCINPNGSLSIGIHKEMVGVEN